MHYERFNDEVACGIKSGKEFVYGVYTCRTGMLTDSAPVFPKNPIVVEGSYSLNPKINLLYDFKIFVEADYETRLHRILERNGAESLEVFRNKWIPLEDRYFKEYGIKEKCDVKIKTDR